MTRELKITRITVTTYRHEIIDMAMEEKLGFDVVYQPGSRLPTTGSILTIETSAGISGQTPGGIDERAARYLLGRNPMQREILWHDLKRARRSADGTPPRRRGHCALGHCRQAL